MSWKEKIDQLTGLLEKLPHPQTFDTKKGVYQPYFIIELRPMNWEILPYAEYTRLDGLSGKEVKLNLQIVESQKVNINQDELNIISYIYSFTNYDSRRLFSYGQPVGFLFDWLRGSRIFIRKGEKEKNKSLEFEDETGTLCLGIFKEADDYVFRPAIVFPENTLILEDQVEVLSSNPTYLYYQDKFYRVESNMSVFFWINFFRTQEQIRIPLSELKDFINSAASKILPALDWKSLEEHLKLYELPLTSSRLYLEERAGQFYLDLRFRYQKIEFPAQPVSGKSLASQANYLFVVRRDSQKEAQVRKILQEHGVFYLQNRWQIDPQYSVFDWLRVEAPRLIKEGIEILGDTELVRYRLRKGIPRLYLTIKSRENWLDLNFNLFLGDEKLVIPDLKAQLLNGKKYLKLGDGSNVHIGDELLHRLIRFHQISHTSLQTGYLKVRPAAYPLVEDLIELSDKVTTDDKYQEWESKYKQFDKIEPVELSPSFNGKLRDYQKSGLDWLYFLNRFSLGGILADDMGLGKTVQVIALLQNLKAAEKLSQPTLIVVPLTVLFNWENEIRRFAPALKILRYYGQKSEREKFEQKIKDYDVVMLSYGILLQDFKILQMHQWEYIILDESQKIKNPLTKTYKAVNQIPGKNRLCLTGTPVENSTTDLWAQLHFLNPDILGSLNDFESRFGKNGKGIEENRELLRKIIKPFILRRKKDDVLKELPERTEITQYVEMTDLQKQRYIEGLNLFREQIFPQADSGEITKVRMKILEALTYLRQITCHPAIFDDTLDIQESGKIQLLQDMLEEIVQEGHKVLVYSQFVRFLNIVRSLVENMEIPYEYLVGSTRSREKVVLNFQSNNRIKIFLLSLKAGGLGLNLTAADYVIHLDPWWNPAVEQQAADRAHRIGQENHVFVYKFITKNSVEEKILNLQKAKQELFENVVIPEKSFLKQLTREDLNFLLEGFGSPTVS
ncbi:MAG: SNF2-related protein [Calditrichota bacterium]